MPINGRRPTASTTNLCFWLFVQNGFKEAGRGRQSEQPAGIRPDRLPMAKTGHLPKAPYLFFPIIK